jgi:hypothetical protein
LHHTPFFNCKIIFKKNIKKICSPKKHLFRGVGALSQKIQNIYFRVTRTGGAVGGWDGGTPDHTLINTSFGTPLGGPNCGGLSRGRAPHDDTYKHNDTYIYIKNKNKNKRGRFVWFRACGSAKRESTTESHEPTPTKPTANKIKKFLIFLFYLLLVWWGVLVGGVVGGGWVGGGHINTKK